MERNYVTVALCIFGTIKLRGVDATRKLTCRFVVGRMNEVTLRRSRLVPGWVTTRISKPPRCIKTPAHVNSAFYFTRDVK